MGRKAPSPGLSETDQLALSQFLAGHLTAGQLSERLQHGAQRSQPSPERPPRRHRRVVSAAVGGVVAAIAATAVALAISSRPHVAASHKAKTAHSQTPQVQGSARVVSEQRTTSSSAQAPSPSSGDRLSLVGPSTPAAPPKRPKRNRHKFSKARHLRAPAGTAPTTSSTGGSTPTATTPTGTTPTGTTPTGTGTALPPPGSPTPPGGTTAPGATTTGGG